MDKPKKCVIPRAFADLYCLTPRDWDNLKDIVHEAVAILDFYHEMPQNRHGILATDTPEQQEELIFLIDELRDALMNMERLPPAAEKEASTAATVKAKRNPENY